MRETGDDRKIDAFSPIRLRKAADEVVAVLVDAIRGGLYEPGEQLPRARDLAAKLEVSGVTVREAVGIMQRAGIVSVRRGNAGGIVVETRFIPPSVIAVIEGQTHTSIRTLLEARRALELSTSLLSAERGSADDFRELRRLVDLFDEVGHQAEEATAVDAQFHLQLARMSGNTLLEEYTRATLNRLTAFRAQFPIGRTSPDLELGRRLQRETLEAVESRDPQRIVAVLDKHLGSLEEHFLGERLRFSSIGA